MSGTLSDLYVRDEAGQLPIDAFRNKARQQRTALRHEAEEILTATLAGQPRQIRIGQSEFSFVMVTWQGKLCPVLMRIDTALEELICQLAGPPLALEQIEDEVRTTA
ncbi:MAG: hypothetical protein KW802_02120 [Candidatus Doudnabacteria bacterium]|nr:hypothetical protein [Candidatus Doudnabacteria bacterium]